VLQNGSCGRCCRTGVAGGVAERELREVLKNKSCGRCCRTGVAGGFAERELREVLQNGSCGRCCRTELYYVFKKWGGGEREREGVQ
jgi:hypothetical protein